MADAEPQSRSLAFSSRRLSPPPPHRPPPPLPLSPRVSTLIFTVYMIHVNSNSFFFCFFYVRVRVFKHSAEEVDVRGDNSVDAEWMAYLGAYRHLRYLNLSDCHRVSTSALWPITGIIIVSIFILHLFLLLLYPISLIAWRLIGFRNE